MRPRQICRGIERNNKSKAARLQASMRPRQICRGIGTEQEYVHESGQLQ